MAVAKIQVKTITDITLNFIATEVKSDSGYGKDVYISIEKVTGNTTEEFQYLVARYCIHYDFTDVLHNFFTDYYGSNLSDLQISINQITV